MRYKYLDYAKGFAIALMIFTHTMGGENGIKTWVSSFHMPIFFIICGVILEGKYAGRTTVQQCVRLAKRRLMQIGIPYLVFGTALACFYSLLNVIAGQPVTLMQRMRGLIALQGIDSLWFLPCYVLAELLAAVLRMGKMKTATYIRNVLLAAGVVLLCLLADRMPAAGWMRVLLKTLVGWIFVEAGALLARYSAIKRIPIGGGNTDTGDCCSSVGYQWICGHRFAGSA